MDIAPGILVSIIAACVLVIACAITSAAVRSSYVGSCDTLGAFAAYGKVYDCKARP